MMYNLKVYKTASGKQPFYQWLEKFSDNKSHAAIDIRLQRLQAGNLGQSKSLSGGLYELKINVGPGYRLYFAIIGLQIILMLYGGDKKSQKKDIIKAREYLNDYKMREKLND